MKYRAASCGEFDPKQIKSVYLVAPKFWNRLIGRRGGASAEKLHGGGDGGLLPDQIGNVTRLQGFMGVGIGQ